jgi:hypothetical protein
VNWSQLCKLAKELPEVREGSWYGTPALQVRGKSFIRLKEDGRSALFLLDSVDEQEFLLQARPEVYFITDHYRGYPSVLARLAALRAPECRLRLERAWRLKAPRDLAKGLDGRAPANVAPRRRR